MKVTNSPEHIKSYIEGTIERLGFTPDLYYLHRIDPSKRLVIPNAVSNHQADRESKCRHSSRGLNPRPRLHPQGRKDKVHRAVRVLGQNSAPRQFEYVVPPLIDFNARR